MPYEDIEVRITKNGEIFVKIEGSAEERLRDYFTFLEETVGLVRAVQKMDGPDWDRPSAALSDAEEEARRRRELDIQH